MTQPDKWDHETERLTRSYWDGCMGDEIHVSRSELATALRQAFAEGERAGRLDIATFVHMHNDNPRLMRKIDEYLRAAKETKA